MSKNKRFVCHAFLSIFFLCILSFNVTAQKSLKIGVVTDVHGQIMAKQLVETISEEIDRTIGSEYTVVLDDVLSNVQTPLESKNAYKQLEDKDLDLILILGPKSLSGIATQPTFKTPTIAVGILDDKLQSLPRSELGTTGKANFTYIQSSTSLQQSVRQFKELADFSTLSVLVDTELAVLFDDLSAKAGIRKLKEELQIDIETIPLTKDNLDDLPLTENTEAAFLLLDFQFPNSQTAIINQKLLENRIPSFSISQEHIQQGILFSYGDNRAQLIRKIALTVDELLQGFSLADMPVNIDLNQKLFINLSTAKEIQFPLTYELIFTANTIDEKNTNPTYDLQSILEKSIEENLTVKVSQKDILNAELDIKQAISNYYPDLDFNGTYSELSDNQANDLLGQSQRSISGNLSLSQVIFSESILANIKINKYLLEAQEYNTQQDILDVLFDTYSNFFAILQNQASLGIQKENLELSKTNLEIAKLKSSLGSTDNSDVFRLEGELAANTQNLIENQANVYLAKLALNQLVNFTLEEAYDIASTDVDSEVFQRYLDHPITEKIQSPLSIEKLTDFLVAEAKLLNPSKSALTANEKLLQRQLLLNKRLFYTPTLSASGSANSTLWRGGAGSTETPNSNFVDESWNVGMILSFPIFDGTRRSLDRQQTKVALDQVALNLQNFDQNIQLAIQSSLIALFTAYTDLNYSKKSKDNQEKNFELNQDKYRVGQVSIVQLLDAQNALVQAKQAYALSVYSFLQSFLQLEYNVGYFSQLATTNKIQDFKNRLIQFLND